MDKGIQAARLADQIRDYIALWSRQDLPGYLFSITQVTLTPDFGRATLWLESFDPEKTELVTKSLSRLLPSYKRKLYRELGKHSCPELLIEIDDSAEKDARFTELLNQ